MWTEPTFYIVFNTHRSTVEIPTGIICLLSWEYDISEAVQVLFRRQSVRKVETRSKARVTVTELWDLLPRPISVRAWREPCKVQANWLLYATQTDAAIMLSISTSNKIQQRYRTRKNQWWDAELYSFYGSPERRRSYVRRLRFIELCPLKFPEFIGHMVGYKLETYHNYLYSIS
jgi:hypothetical protein